MRFAIILAFVFALVGAGTWYFLTAKKVGAPPPPKLLTLEAGTPVKLVLLRQIEAGSTIEGVIVPLMVAEDVKDSEGNVLVEKGSIAEGDVVWSRSEGTLSSVMNQPARLAVNISRARAAGQEDVRLRTDPEGKPDEPYQFTRENTGKPWENGEFEKMAGDDAQRAFMESLAKSLNEYLSTGNAQALQTDDRTKILLGSLLKEPGMESARKFLDPSGEDRRDAEKLSSVYGHLRDGSITKVSSADVLLAVSALTELSRLAGAVDHALGRKFKGRKIKAYIGTPVQAFVAESVVVKVASR